MELIDRPEYIEKLKMWRDYTDVVKIVTGVRRCGKSILLTLFQNYLRANGVEKDQIQEIKFELEENECLLDRKKWVNCHFWDMKTWLKPIITGVF